MLLLFALSITPKQWLHDAITGHKHFSTSSGHEKIQSAKNNFQCNWHEQLVESPFINEPDFQLGHPVIIHASYTLYYTFNYYSPERFFSSLRGPPAIA
jgi:hypothetical protein